MNDERTYLLERIDGEPCVLVMPGRDRPSYDLWRRHLKRFGTRHSPGGFEWGYGGSGPAELARAICCDFEGREVEASVYQDFKWRYIASCPREGCVLVLRDLEDIGVVGLSEVSL